jgi:hypothetical protein
VRDLVFSDPDESSEKEISDESKSIKEAEDKEKSPLASVWKFKGEDYFLHFCSILYVMFSISCFILLLSR